MSKIGKINISIPEKVNVALNGSVLNVDGPLGKKALNIDTNLFESSILWLFLLIELNLAILVIPHILEWKI